MSTFQENVVLCKKADMPMLSQEFKSTSENEYCMKIFLKGRENCQNLKDFNFQIGGWTERMYGKIQLSREILF